MLSEIVQVVEPVEPVVPAPVPETFDQLIELAKYLDKSKLTYRGKSLIVKGIPEDFKVLLDGKLVCECVYDRIYHENADLCRELLS